MKNMENKKQNTVNGLSHDEYISSLLEVTIESQRAVIALLKDKIQRLESQAKATELSGRYGFPLLSQN